MPSIEYLRPVVYKADVNSNFQDWRGLGFVRAQSRVSNRNSPRCLFQNPVPFPTVSLYGQTGGLRISILNDFGLWRDRRLRSNGGFRRVKMSASGQDSDSGEKSESEGQGVNKKSPSTGSSSSPSSSNRRREKQDKGNWWWSKGGGGGKWRWQPIIQAQEIGILLLQLGIVIFVMRLLRPGIPLPGSEPRTSTTFVSVPYSDFLSKISGNQVQKVEVDGVHIMFKLKDEAATGQEGEASSSSSSGVSKFQESEALIRSVAPTKRVVYTTTRPSDIKAPYEKMLENEVEFGSPDKRSGGFLNSALVSFLFPDMFNVLKGKKVKM